MAWRPHGRARVSATNPQAFAVCDRCSLWYNRVDLSWQYQWAGNMTQNLQLLVCRECLDVPQQQLRTIFYPPDPLPIFNPRPEDFDRDNIDYRILEDGTTVRVLEDGSTFRVLEENGDDMMLYITGQIKPSNPFPPPTPPGPPAPGTAGALQFNNPANSGLLALLIDTPDD